MHPLGIFAANAIEQEIRYRMRGPGEGRAEFDATCQDSLKDRYGQLINATAREIGFTGGDV